ncbi:uncharacterized protein UTRI_02189 [Ustilago trichophora]|uniref:Uncharacterized protein n=1 Tax=Ustilago trichophora TaxID=86804 RepID=A0A5C3E0L9_9BASI|nr:uncharacterized protein UTRI_02189 [Ustilago trichophora]
MAHSIQLLRLKDAQEDIEAEIEKESKRVKKEGQRRSSRKKGGWLTGRPSEAVPIFGLGQTIQTAQLHCGSEECTVQYCAIRKISPQISISLQQQQQQQQKQQ